MLASCAGFELHTVGLELLVINSDGERREIHSLASPLLWDPKKVHTTLPPQIGRAHV